MPRKYGKKASEKVERTMHEFKRGTLKSGSGKKVTSRKQAIAIGLSQARRAGGKVPPAPRGHATMKTSLDERVRVYLSKMRPGAEIDARGIARALGGVDPLAADYALERAQKDGLAVTDDGKWFGPAGTSNHARKKTPAQLDREIAEAISRNRRLPKSSHASKHASKTSKTSKTSKKQSRPASDVQPFTPYRIKLSPSELRAVEFARGRYSWPDMLAVHAAEDGSIVFTESEMWQWTDDVDSDTAGGHAPFPLASDTFAEKLQRFYDERV